MPSREKKTVREPAKTILRNSGASGNNAGKLQLNRTYPAGNSTRINAFVSAQGRRNQAKRDSR